MVFAILRYCILYRELGQACEEVHGADGVVLQMCYEESDELIQQGVKINVIGKRGNMSEKVIEHLELIEKTTSAGDKLDVMLALNYGSRE